MAHKHRGTGYRSKSRDAYYKHYKAVNKRASNQIKKLQRHIKKFPDDIQAKESLTLMLKGNKGVPNERKYRWVHKNNGFKYREKV